MFCLHVHHVCAVPMGTRRGHKIPRTGVTDGCELLHVYQEPNLESFSKAATALSYWAISPVLHISSLIPVFQPVWLKWELQVQWETLSPTNKVESNTGRRGVSHSIPIFTHWWSDRTPTGIHKARVECWPTTRHSSAESGHLSDFQNLCFLRSWRWWLRLCSHWSPCQRPSNPVSLYTTLN